MAEIHGTVDNDDLSGTAEADVFYLQHGGATTPRSATPATIFSG